MSLLTYDDYLAQYSVVDPEIDNPLQDPYIPPTWILQFNYTISRFPSKDFYLLTKVYDFLFIIPIESYKSYISYQELDIKTKEQKLKQNISSSATEYLIKKAKVLSKDLLIKYNEFAEQSIRQQIPSLSLYQDDILLIDTAIQLCRVIYRTLQNPNFNPLLDNYVLRSFLYNQLDPSLQYLITEQDLYDFYHAYLTLTLSLEKNNISGQ